jgi:hypothetical protein
VLEDFTEKFHLEGENVDGMVIFNGYLITTGCEDVSNIERADSKVPMRG